MTNSQHHPNPQTLIMPFQVPSRGPCTAKVTISPDSDPIHHGQDLVSIYDDPLVTTGFPILHGTVTSPHSRTYAAIYGWIQVTKIPVEPWVMDIYPPFANLNNPFFSWGAEPTAVDAPSRDVRDPKWDGYNWTARTFLVYDPKAAMERVVVPILAVEWGFIVKDGKVIVKELRRLAVSVWNEHVELFKGRFDGWIFEEARDIV